MSEKLGGDAGSQVKQGRSEDIGDGTTAQGAAQPDSFAFDEQSEGDRPSPWEQVRSGAPTELVQLGMSVQQLRAAVTQALNAADEPQRARVRELLDETRRGIYAILAEKD